MQVAGLLACATVSACAALAACWVLVGALCALGLPAGLAGSPAMFAAFTLAAVWNPAAAALLPLLAPVRLLPWEKFSLVETAAISMALEISLFLHSARAAHRADPHQR